MTLTPRQREAVWLVSGHAAVTGRPPTLRELGGWLGVSHETARRLLAAARRQGYVTWERDAARTLRVQRAP